MVWQDEADIIVENGGRVGQEGDPAYIEKMLPCYKQITDEQIIYPHSVSNRIPCKYNPVTNDFESNYTPDEAALAATNWEVR